MIPSRLFKRELQVIRYAEGSLVEYQWIDGAEETFTIWASVQPTPAEILMTLPEGYRTRSLKTLYTNTKLNTSVTNETSPDIVIIDNEKYVVIQVAPWNNTKISHWKITVAKEHIDANN
jgi:hypothetical protein